MKLHGIPHLQVEPRMGPGLQNMLVQSTQALLYPNRQFLKEEEEELSKPVADACLSLGHSVLDSAEILEEAKAAAAKALEQEERKQMAAAEEVVEEEVQGMEKETAQQRAERAWIDWQQRAAEDERLATATRNLIATLKYAEGSSDDEE